MLRQQDQDSEACGPMSCCILTNDAVNAHLALVKVTDRMTLAHSTR